MPDSKITALTALTAADPANDMFPIVDVSDTSMAASGTTKRISINNLLAASGTATLASATITGDLTVDTSTLKVDSANNRVGIGTASPAALVDVSGAKDATNMIVGAPLSTVGGVAFVNYSELLFKNTAGSNSDASIRAYGNVWNAGGSQLALFTSNNGAVTERYRIDNTGVATWSNVGGVAGTAMTLNAGGLAIGTATNYGKLSVAGSIASFASATIGAVSANSGYVVYSAYAGAGAYISLQPTNSAGTQFEAARIDTNGNLILSSSTVPATLASNYQLTLNATSNTNLRFSYRGSDGVTRVANITLA